MNILISALLFTAGLVVIVKCSDIFVDAASWMSDVTGFSKAVIGATIVSFATTAPEYFVSLVAVLKGHYDLSIGNAVGSLSANMGIAFAAIAILAPEKIRDKRFGIKGLVMILAASLLLLFCLNDLISVFDGVVLLSIFVFFAVLNVRYSREDEGPDTQRKKAAGKEIFINAAKFIGGAAGIVFGSNLIVDNAVILASFLGVSEAIIGLTIIAIGTSLPEIITSIAAIIKKQNAISIGNIVGANVINISLVLSTGAFVSGGHLTVSPSTVRLDLPVTIVLMILAVLPVAIGKKLYRLQGLALAAVYVSYLIYITVF